MFKKLVLLLISLFLVVSCSQPPEAVYSKQQVSIDQLRDSTVLLLRKNGVKYRGKCGGVWINKTQFITAYHCVERNPKTKTQIVEKMVFGKEPNVIGAFEEFSTWRDVNDMYSVERPILAAYTAIVVGADPKADLALLTTVDDGVVHSYVQLASPEELEDGMSLHLVGHPHNLYYTYSPGILSITRNVKNPGKHYVKLFQIHSSAFRGYSGNGAFTEDGKLMGISSFVYNPAEAGPFLTMYVHRDVVAEFLEL